MHCIVSCITASGGEEEEDELGGTGRRGRRGRRHRAFLLWGRRTRKRQGEGEKRDKKKDRGLRQAREESGEGEPDKRQEGGGQQLHTPPVLRPRPW